MDGCMHEMYDDRVFDMVDKIGKTGDKLDSGSRLPENYVSLKVGLRVVASRG